jgi:hypothetical protein
MGSQKPVGAPKKQRDMGGQKPVGAPKGRKNPAGGKREARSPRKKGACANKPRRGGRHQIEIRDRDIREQNSRYASHNGLEAVQGLKHENSCD